MSVILTGPSPLVPRPEEGGARTAGAHFTDGETEAHSSMPKFTLQAAEGVGTHPGVHPESSARVWGPQSGALPTTVPLSASLRCRGGALPFHERAFSLLPISASVLGSLQGTRHIGGHGVGDGEEMTPKGNTNHVEKDLFFKNSPSCLSSRAGVHSLRETVPRIRDMGDVWVMAPRGLSNASRGTDTQQPRHPVQGTFPQGCLGDWSPQAFQVHVC